MAAGADEEVVTQLQEVGALPDDAVRETAAREADSRAMGRAAGTSMTWTFPWSSTIKELMGRCAGRGGQEGG